MRIQAAIATQSGVPFQLMECELARPLPHELRVEIRACGVCHTDLTARDGGLPVSMPAVLGHEGVGVVCEIGAAVQGLAEGDHVLLSFGFCGTCPACLEHAPAYCKQAYASNLRGYRPDGSAALTCQGEPVSAYFFGQSSFASQVLVDARQAIRIDADLPLELMAPLACGVQTGVGSVMNVMQPRSSDAVVVYGCGTVGLSAIMAARLAGCRAIAAVDRVPARLELAQELGATHCGLADESSTARTVRKLGISFALDTTGSARVIEGALDVLQARGMVVCAGLSYGDPVQVHPTMLATTGKRLRGTVEGDAEPATFVPQMLRWYREGHLPLEKIVTFYCFDAINSAAADMLAGNVVKPVLTWR